MGHGPASDGTSLTVRQPAFLKAPLRVTRLPEVTVSYFCCESIHSPVCRVEWASQLIPPNVGDVRNALRSA
jgi:hypothetical protein